MTPRHLQSHSSLNPSIEVDSFIHRYLTIRRSNWRGFHLRPFQRAFIKYICEDQKKDNLAVKRSCLLLWSVVERFGLKGNAMNSVTCEGLLIWRRRRGWGGGRIRKGTKEVKQWRGDAAALFK